MPQKMHQAHNISHVGHSNHTDSEAYKDEAIVSLIAGLNALIAQAGGSGMGMAARILYTAKEELVHWAVDMNFHETSKDRFINQQLYENGLATLGEFMMRVGALQDETLKIEIVKILGSSLLKTPQLSNAGEL